MKSTLAKRMRDAQQQADLQLPVEERIHRALVLGERDLAIYMAANSLNRTEALRRLEAGKQQGRIACQARRSR